MRLSNIFSYWSSETAGLQTCKLITVNRNLCSGKYPDSLYYVVLLYMISFYNIIIYHAILYKMANGDCEAKVRRDTLL